MGAARPAARPAAATVPADLPLVAPPDTSLAPAAAAPRLRASWRRSARYGVPADEVRAVFTGAVPTDSLFYECGTSVLRDLQSTVANEPVSFMITDADGLVLARLCDDRSILRALDRVHLAPGFWYDEATAGTNGLALALADRRPSLVRADEHWCATLRGYTCAAVPVTDPVSGALAGSINLTTWSDASSDLLLALARAAAGTTTALMQLRSGTAAATPPAPAARGEVFHVVADRVPDPDADPCRAPAWRSAVEEVRRGLAAGHLVAVVGEAGAGKAVAASLAWRAQWPRDRVLLARPPAPEDVPAWLALWLPELGADRTGVVLSRADTVPTWAAGDLAAAMGAAAGPRSASPSGPTAGVGGRAPLVLTATDLAGVPTPLRDLVDAVVEVPPLRHRPDDVVPLARFLARRERHRDVEVTARAATALQAAPWPGNVRQLREVVGAAAARTDRIDVGHLPPELLGGGTRPLRGLARLERDEIVRCLTAPGATVVDAAAALGMSRATLYRRMAQYDIRLPR